MRRRGPEEVLRVPTTTRRALAWMMGAFVAVAATGVLAAAPGVASAAAPTVPQRLTVAIGQARQLIVVTSAGWSSTSASLSTWERTATGWKQVHGPFTARIGRNGFKVDHREGDGTAPAGSFPIVGTMGRQPNPGVRFPYRQLTPGDCWISDSASPAYNTLVRANPCRRPNEDLYAIGAGAYRYAAITGYNTAPVVAGRGSAIFLHRHSYGAGGATKATSGCVSLAEPQLLAVLRWLDPAKQPRIAMGPEAWLLRPVASPPSAWTDLAIGARGANVARLQQALTRAGIPTAADGWFGPQTQRNLRTYQARKGLPVTGVADVRTATALGLVAATAPAPRPPPAAGGTISRWLRVGSRGADVAVLQRRLTVLGFPAVADGVFGNQTAGAVRAFQRSRALVVDGVVGPVTGRALGIWAA
jgi:L,D-peptidoglycan transpeptidase YkuD (ErfK/YbiS/YcfS/YnhG family)/peptidoglycan hydrolase-like protein with peptidoglycan-binding domain